MIGKIKHKLKTFYKYQRAIDGMGSIACIIDEVLNKEKLRAVRISGFDIHVRMSTTDLNVAISCLYENEYNHLTAANPKTIIDLGAYIGTSAIYFATRYPGALVLAVEPEAGNFDLLKKNTRNFHNIIPIHAAIWGTNDKRIIKNRFTGPWGYTISDTHNDNESMEQVIECITIKNLMDTYQLDKIDILKMDIEGSEKNVLENSLEWIGSVEILTAELHDRICMGCDRAFYLATKDFEIFEKHGEKVTAYRNTGISSGTDKRIEFSSFTGTKDSSKRPLHVFPGETSSGKAQ